MKTITRGQFVAEVDENSGHVDLIGMLEDQDFFLYVYAPKLNDRMIHRFDNESATAWPRLTEHELVDLRILVRLVYMLFVDMGAYEEWRSL